MAQGGNRDDVDRFFEYNINFATSTLYLGSVDSDEEGEPVGVNHNLAEKVIKGLHILESAGKKEITIIMNNTGGVEQDGMAIYDMIQSLDKTHVTIKVFGSSMSMGSVILQAADHRLMAPHAKLLLHYGSIEIPGGHSKDSYKWVDYYKEFDTIMENIYLKRIQEKKKRFTLKQLREKMAYEWIIGPKEALQLGLIDEILGQE